MASARTYWALLTSLLLATTVLAGCVQEDPGADAGQDDAAGEDDAASPSGDDNEEEEALTREDGYAVYESAFSNLDGASTSGTSGEAPARVSMHLSGEALNTSEEQSIRMDVFVDGEDGFLVWTMDAEGLGEERASGPFQGGSLVMGTAWKTTFMGTRETLSGFHDPEAEPPTGLEDATGEEDLMGEDMSPSAFLEEFRNLTKNEIGDVRRTTLNGENALEITATWTEESANFTGTLVMYTDPARPASMEATFEDPEAEDPMDRHGRLRMAFRYGEHAGHDLEDTLKRLETMTIASSSDMGGSWGEDEEKSGENHTIQPSRFNDHRAPLDAVEVRLTNEEGDEANHTTLVLNPAEGLAENEDVRATFTDEDGDGLVSTGDRIHVEWKTENGKAYTVGVYDKESGILLTPAAGVLAFLATVGAAAAAGTRLPRGRR